MSNPPVHAGVPDDLRVLAGLIAGAPARLLPGGTLWLVTQAQVPAGLLLAAEPAYTRVHAERSADGRFVVWKAVLAGGEGDEVSANEPPEPAPASSSASDARARKRRRDS